MFTLLDITINRGHSAQLFQILPALLKLFAYSTPLKFESEDGTIISFIALDLLFLFSFVFFTECPSFPISLSGNGTISSPNYPGSNYPSSRTCEWIIEAMAGRRVMVNITDFAMGTCNGCSSTTTCSRVEFYDGPTKDSPLLERFCTGSQREDIISSGVQLFVRFESGFSPDRGFQANYAEILSSTAETIATTATTIATTTTTIATTATTIATTETTGRLT